VVDRRRQRATKRRIKRGRLNRRYGGKLVWAGLALIALAIAFLVLNHFVLTRGESTITVEKRRIDVAQNRTRYRVFDQGGKAYWVRGRDRAELYSSLEPGQTFRCKVRGMDVEIPLFWDLLAEVTSCRSV